MEQEVFVVTVMAIVGLLFIAAVSALIMKRLRFPYTVGLVLVGVAVAFISEDLPALGEALEQLKFGPAMILFIFIPILIFESAFNMDVRLLLKNIVPTMTLAAPGLLLSTAIVGGLMYWLTPLPLASALIFGCLISATDPVAVIALFKEIGAPRRLNILVEGESVFNDATAIVTFHLILAVATVGVLDGWTVAAGVGNFFVVFFGGLLVGLALGYALIRAIPLIGDEPIVHLTFTLVIAYSAFIIAEHYLQTSGIMAVLGAGMVIGYYRPLFERTRAAEYLHVFWENIAFIANSLIFLMLGLSEKVFLVYAPNNVEGLLIPVLTAIAVVFLARLIVVYALIPWVNAIPGANPISRRYRAVMAWGGLRGAVAVALAMSLPPSFPYRWQIIDLTFGVTLFMLVFNGASMRWLMSRLKLDKPPPVLEFMSAYATAAAKRNALARLDSHTPLAPVSDTAKARVKADYEEQVQDAERCLNELRAQLGKDRKTGRKLLWLRALAIQQQAYQRRYEEGLLSFDALHELEWSLRHQDIGLYRDNYLPGVSPLPEEERLGAGLLRLLQQALPRLKLLKRLQTQRFIDLHEEASAVVAACRSVLAEMDYLSDFSGAAAADLEACRRYFTQSEKVAAARLEFIEARIGSASEIVHERLLYKAASDGEKAVIRRSALSGELPEPLAEQLEQELESGR